eukprot:564483-Prymnesium_polylepis.1
MDRGVGACVKRGSAVRPHTCWMTSSSTDIGSPLDAPPAAAAVAWATVSGGGSTPEDELAAAATWPATGGATWLAAG